MENGKRDNRGAGKARRPTCSSASIDQAIGCALLLGTEEPSQENPSKCPIWGRLDIANKETTIGEDHG